MRHFYKAFGAVYHIIITVLLLLFLGNDAVSQDFIIYDQAGSHTFTVPAGVTSITVHAWGGGGGGGGAGSTVNVGNWGRGGGGGGGAYKMGTFDVAPNQQVSLIVGAGGGGGDITSGDGTGDGGKGESSSFLTLSAEGGYGGKGARIISGNIMADGGQGGEGDFNGGKGGTASNAYTGSGGGSAGSGGNGNDGRGTASLGLNYNLGGMGGIGIFPGGAGANGFVPTGGNGTDATELSGGGSGAYELGKASNVGGKGAKGKIIIIFNTGYCYSGARKVIDSKNINGAVGNILGSPDDAFVQFKYSIPPIPHNGGISSLTLDLTEGDLLATGSKIYVRKNRQSNISGTATYNIEFSADGTSFTAPQSFFASSINFVTDTVTLPIDTRYIKFVVTSTNTPLLQLDAVTFFAPDIITTGSISTTAVCLGDQPSLTLSGNTGTIDTWEYYNGNNWVDINDNSSTPVVPAISRPTEYRVKFSGGTCGTVYSVPATAPVKNYWAGRTNTNWNTTSNWSDEQLPTDACPDVYFPTSAPFQPELSSGSVQLNNIVMENGTLLNVSNDAVIKVAGDFTLNGSAKIDLTNGTLELNGINGQTIASSYFRDTTIKHLVVSNNTGVNVSSTGNSLAVTDIISFGTAKGKLNSGDNITLKSNAQTTANLGELGAGNEGDRSVYG